MRTEQGDDGSVRFFSACNLLRVQHAGEDIVEVVQQAAPLLVRLRFSETHHVIFQRLPDVWQRTSSM